MHFFSFGIVTVLTPHISKLIDIFDVGFYDAAMRSIEALKLFHQCQYEEVHKYVGLDDHEGKEEDYGEYDWWSTLSVIIMALMILCTVSVDDSPFVTSGDFEQCEHGITEILKVELMVDDFT